MKLQTTSFALVILLSLLNSPGAQGREVLVNDPGEDITVHMMESVPNVMGDPGEKDPILKISSNVPVSILLYHDSQYLMGGEPIQKQDVYIVVKSNCASNESISDIQLAYTEYNRTSYTGWDTANYTETISINVIPSETTTLMTDDEFLEPTSFLAYWDYTSFFCQNEPEIETKAPGSTDSPTPVTEFDTAQGGSGAGAGSIVGGTTQELESAENAAAPTPSPTSTQSASAAKSGLLATLLAGVIGAALGLRDNHHPGRSTGLKVLTLLAMTGVLMVHFQTANSSDPVAQQHTLESPVTRTTTAFNNNDQVNQQEEGGQRRRRQLQDVAVGAEACTASVEILLDGCRRSMFDNKVDIQVEAPDVRVIDVDFTELSNGPNPENACTTDYVGLLDFNATDEVPLDPSVNLEVTTESPQTYFIPSLTEDWSNGVQCSRPVEGRPFIDAGGMQLQASIQMTSRSSGTENNQNKAAWSANKTLYSHQEEISADQELGQEWAERALGEHASVPAFAAFTIALMSNNAPPRLVHDALTAAMDEVRHAQTSFEVASLLLGTTVEPGPIPPSTHTFGQDLTALAMAAAQEGCVDETLSALAAAFDVDTRIEQNPRINDFTKSLLKDKIRTIALEETRHSALAWRTVRWACEMDPAVCSTVRETIFAPENLLRAFEKRFGRYGMDANARTAWEKVYSQLIPLVVEDSSEVSSLQVDCELIAAQRRLADTDESFNDVTLLEQMAMHIIQDTICATTK